MVPIDDLIPYANNAKKHGVKQINQIRASLREFGFVTRCSSILTTTSSQATAG